MQKIFVFFFIGFLNATIHAQIGNLQQKISLNVTDIPLTEVLDNITKQTGIHFVYSPDMIDLKRKISIHESNISLKKALTRLLAPHNIEFIEIGDQIILKAKKKVEKVVLSGTILDGRTGEQLVFASVSVPEHAITTTSNAYGYFSFSVPQNANKLYVSYVGYKTFNREIDVLKDTSLEILLFPDTTSMKEIIIADFSWKQNLYSIHTGLNRINMQSLREIPQILGESDVLKGIQSLPGVQASHEGSNSLYIRGGNPDQNLFILDGVSMYNINHLFGYFSVFNAGAVQNTMLYKSGFPARYGGRLSSIVDMKLKEGNTQHYQVIAATGTLTSSITIEGPLGKNASFYLSGRRTYFDLLMKPALYYINLKNKDSTNLGLDANFYDLVAKVNISLSEKSHLYFSNYIGGDLFGSQNNTKSLKEGGDLHWNNLTSALRWNYKWNSNLFINNTFTYSHFNFKLDQSVSGVDTLKRLIEYDANFNSGISDLSLRSDWEYYASDAHNIQFGAGGTRHNFNGGKISGLEKLENQSNTYKLSNNVPFTYEWFIYAEDIWKFHKNWSAQIGLHSAFINYSNYFDYSLQPRLGLHYLLNQKWAIKASYTRMGQFLHLTSAGIPGSLSFDIWVPVATYVKPQHCQQFAIGPVFIPNQKWEISLEMYYKKFSDLLERKLYVDEYSGLLEWGKNWNVSNGYAKGLEFLLQKKEGSLQGWLSYTLSLSNRTFNTNFGLVSAALENSHKHLFNCKLTYDISPKIHVSALWTFGSGALITFPKQKYQSSVAAVPTLYYTEGFNNYKLAPYHRLDLGVSFIKKKKIYTRTWNIGIYNTYNQRNPNFIEIRKSKFIKYSYFSLVPSLSYVIEFNLP